MATVLTSIAGRFRVLRSLGEGMTGDVYLVEGPDGEAALKLLKPFADRQLEAGLVAAFKFEFGLLKDLRHPNVVRIREFGFDEKLGRFYFTQEFLQARPIQDFCRDASPGTIEDLFRQALAGLAAIHRANILHGDIKGNNIMITAGPGGPVLKFIDFGLSDPRFPFAGGTPSTMAPEKILQDPADERSDLYSLGVVFYQLFTGDNPFVRDTVKKTYEAHLSLRPAKATLVNPKAPPHLNGVLATLLEKNPSHRYRGASEVLEAIALAAPRRAGGAARPEIWRPDLWVVRPEITDALFLRMAEAWREDGGRPAARLFLLTGESGSGKSRLAQEVKYRLQMDKGKTFETRPDRGQWIPPPEETVDLWIVEDWDERTAEERARLLPEIAARARIAILTLAAAAAPELAPEWETAGLQAEEHPIRPLSRDELEAFLKKLTSLADIPAAFLGGLWGHTHGNPKLVIATLQNLVKQNKLIDAQGRWNLSIFKEGEWDWVALPLEISQIDQALAQVPAGDLERRVQLWLKRAEERLRHSAPAEAAQALDEAERACEGISDLTARFHAKARIHERNGYRWIREGRYEEARPCFDRALTLLNESGIQDEVLSIRLNNFLAWLLCQEGKVDAAIERFARQHERWTALPEGTRAQILNNDIGFAYLLKGDGAKAADFLQEYLPFLENLDDAPSLMKARYNLAEAHVLTRRYAEAIEQYTLAADRARREKNYEFLLRAYNGLGKTHHLQGANREALDFYGRALELARYLEDFSGAAAIAQNIGSIQSENSDFTEAQAHFDVALKMIARLPERSAHDKYLQCRALIELGDLYRKQKRYEEARGIVREAHVLAQNEDSLAGFRFWVIHTQCKIERDQGRAEQLRDLLGDLLPLVDDDSTREALAEFSAHLPSAAAPQPNEDINMTIDRTRAENISSTFPPAPELKALMQVARWLAGEKDPDILLEKILRQAVELSGAEAGILLMADGAKLAPRSAVNLNLDDPLRLMSENVAREVLATGRPVLASDAQSDERFKVYESVLIHHLQSILALPIVVAGGTAGVFALLHRFRAGAFAPERVELMSAFADLSGIALENARLVADLRRAKQDLERDLDDTAEELDEARRNLSEHSIVQRFAKSRLQSRNPAMLALFKLVERVKDTSLSVLLRGESGTGKERIARTLHGHSRRARAPFVAVNCAALPAHLIESELFGYKAGAFTGATRDKKGLIAEADGGTLFLDEIAELEIGLQAKLLRVLQEKEITRVGDTRSVPVDFRLIAASHRNLKERVAEGTFREDLYYRVCEIELTIPPLRERKEDIALLAEAFIEQYREEHGEKGKVQLGRDLLKMLMEYHWPGNVRELENVIRVGAALRNGPAIHTQDLTASLQDQLRSVPQAARGKAPPSRGAVPSRSKSSGRLAGEGLFDPEKTWEEMELLLIAKALIHHGFDATAAAGALNCAPSKLYQRIKEHRLEANREEWEDHPFAYQKGMKLEKMKRDVFRQALKHWSNSPYQTAKALGVSPGMVYKWTA